MCREMGIETFEFFLDEMIMMRNETTNSKLEQRGHHPGYWTREQVQKN
jgi:hypothetical protein